MRPRQEIDSEKIFSELSIFLFKLNALAISVQGTQTPVGATGRSPLHLILGAKKIDLNKIAFFSSETYFAKNSSLLIGHLSSFHLSTFIRVI